MEVCVLPLHPIHHRLENVIHFLFFVIQTTVGRKDLENIHSFMYTRSFASLWMTIMENVKKAPFHRKVKGVKGLGTNFHVYRQKDLEREC